jgi:hypothetical protein
MSESSDEMWITSAAREFCLGYYTVWHALLRGEILGRRDSRGRWRVSTASVKGFAERRQRAGGVAEDGGEGSDRTPVR